MKKKILLLIILFIIFGAFNTYVFALDDYNSGDNVSVVTRGGGEWLDYPLAIRISIVDKDKNVKEVKRILSLQSDTIGVLCNPGKRRHYFNTDNNPKISADSSQNSWGWSTDYKCTNYLPSDRDWKNGNDIFNLNDHLKGNNTYDNLKNILDETGIKNSIAPGDYIIVEPMTRIGGTVNGSSVNFFGTAYELARVFSLQAATKAECNDGKNTPCYMYSKAVFGGSSNNQTGGMFFTTIYLDKDVPDLGLTTFTPNAEDMAEDTGTTKYINERNRRNACFTSQTCGRGIGVYKANDIYKLKVSYNANGGLVTNTTKDYKLTNNVVYKKSTNEKYYQTWTYNERYQNSNGEYTGLTNITTFGITRTGYRFVGWNTKKDGTGTTFAQDDDSLTPMDLTSNRIVEEITLYAMWEVNKYTLDLNYCIDGIIKHDLPRYPTNFSYDFKLNGEDSSSTHYLGSIESGTSYQISNIVSSGEYRYQGYNVGTNAHCEVHNEGGISGTLTGDTTINLIFKSPCEATLDKIKEEYFGKMYLAVPELFELYKSYKDKHIDYRGLLNINNPTCSTFTPTSKEPTLTCLGASTLLSNFDETNLMEYDEIITDARGNYIGFCSNSMHLTNRLGVSNFYSKSGQFLVKQFEGNSEIEIYDSNYNLVKIPNDYVASSIMTKTCYSLDGYTPTNLYGLREEDYVQIYFGDNNSDGEPEILTGEFENLEEAHKKISDCLIEHLWIYNGIYKLNSVNIEKMTGKVVEDGEYTLKGIITKFNSTSGKVPFEVYYREKRYGTNELLCQYNSLPELVKENKLNLEFRIIDTKKPFNRNTKSNWSNGSDNSKDNDTVKQYIINKNNSYDSTGESYKYKIILTPSDIKTIRKYNKDNNYDDYRIACYENNKCTNSFLYSLSNNVNGLCSWYYNEIVDCYGSLQNRLEIKN